MVFIHAFILKIHSLWTSAPFILEITDCRFFTKEALKIRLRGRSLLAIDGRSTELLLQIAEELFYWIEPW